MSRFEHLIDGFLLLFGIHKSAIIFKITYLINASKL